MGVSFKIIQTEFRYAFAANEYFSAEAILHRSRSEMEKFGQKIISESENKFTSRPNYILHLTAHPFSLVWNSTVSVTEKQNGIEVKYAVFHPVAPLLFLLACTAFYESGTALLILLLMIMQYMGHIYFMQLMIYRKIIQPLKKVWSGHFSI